MVVTALLAGVLVSAAPQPPAAGSGKQAIPDIPLPPPPVLVPRAPRAGGAAEPSGGRRPQKALRLALPDVRVTGELPPRQLALLEGALLAEVRKYEGVSAIGMGEIREMLSFEYQRQMLGCQADENCLAEIGGALGTDEMVHAAVVVDGKTATFSLKRIDMRSARVAGAHQKRLTRAGGEELLGAVGPAVKEVFPDRSLRPGLTQGVDKAVALRLNPPPLPRWSFYATASAALAAAAAGAGMGYLSRDAQTQYDDLARRSLVEPVSGSQLRELESTAKSRAQTANVLFFAAGGLAVAAGVQAFFTDWHGYRAQVDVQPKGATVRVGGTF